MDTPALQHEASFFHADRWHRIGHEHELADRFATKCQLHRNRRDVVAIDDQSAPAVPVLQRCPYHAGFATIQRRHRVEEMGEAGNAGVQRRSHLFVIRVGMAGADDSAPRPQVRNDLWRSLLRRKRDQCSSVLQARHQFDVLFLEFAELRLVMHTLAIGAEERPFQVNAGDPRNARLDRSVDGGNGRGHLFQFVADQGRKQRRGAKLRVRSGYLADRLHSGISIEQLPSPAIDLHVNEPGQYDCTFEVDDSPITGGNISAVNADDQAPVDVQSNTGAKGAVEQHLAADKECRTHLVSVTFIRCGGASGFSPSCTAQELTKR